jgi:hypothetical protein
VTAAINIQAAPVPIIWASTGAAQPYTLADESGVEITDEAGTKISPE